MNLREVFARLADHAKLENRPAPVITTDFSTGRLLLNLLCEDCGWIHGMRPPDWPPELIGMFDGIKIVARRPEISQHEVDGWRRHFGVLADIWN